MKIKHTKNLFGYSALAASFLSLTQTAGAQVIYTDVSPDDLLSDAEWAGSDIHYFDINGDGVNDIYVGVNNRFSSAYSSEDNANFYMRGINGAKVAYSISYFHHNTYGYEEFGYPSSAYVVKSVNEGDVISSAFNFINNQVVLREFSCDGWSSEDWDCLEFGNFEAGTPHYAAVQLNVSGSSFYGWMRLQFVGYGDEDGSPTQGLVLDHGYNATAEASVTAGEMPPLTCDPPVIVSSMVTASSIKLIWNAADNAQAYKIRYRKAGGAWQKLNAATTTKKITGLECNSSYEVRLYTLCNDGITSFLSAASAPYYYTTAACKTGEAETEEDVTINISPNPAAHTLYIQTTGFQSELQINIYNIAGEEVRSFSASAKDDLQLDISNMADGMYIINITDNEKSYSEKFIRQQ